MLKSLVVASVAVFAAASAGAVTIPLSAKVAGPQTGPGTGLSGKFYDQNIVDPVGMHAPGALGTVDGTFRSTTLNYCCGEDYAQSVSDFLGSDGASFVGDNTTTFDSSVLTFDGFINITNDMDFDPSTAGIQFDVGIGSDDGFDLVIGGVDVGSAGARGFGYSYLPVDFAEAGLYAFSLLYFENGGEDGLYVGQFVGEGVRGFSADSFYLSAPDGGTDVPEPAMLGLFGLGTAGLIAARRRP